MHEVRITLDDAVFAAFQKRAKRLGNISAEELIREVVESEALDIDASGLFSAERLEIIDRSVDEADRGQLNSIDQVDSHLDAVRKTWNQENAS
jgi:hypothetical protein